MKSGYVAIAGRPNAGKSTLLNRVLGSRLSIVTPKAQTTRERLFGILTEEKRGQIVFVDTPGIHQARPGGINAYMVSEAREALKGTVVNWYLLDPQSELKHERVVLEILAQSPHPVFLIVNKMDLTREGPALEGLVSRIKDEAKTLGISIEREFRITARIGKGVGELVQATWDLMPEGPIYYPDPEQLSDRPTRYFVAEKVREQLFKQLGDELPYSSAIEIEKFDESVSPPRIEAIIYVERETQKGMVVGKGGLKIRAIGTSARHEIEQFMGEQVFLGLKVKVLKDWTRDSRALRSLGYFLPGEGKSDSRSGGYAQ